FRISHGQCTMTDDERDTARKIDQEKFPNELWVDIISYLGVEDRKNLRLTNKKLSSLVAESDLVTDKISIHETFGGDWEITLDDELISIDSASPESVNREMSDARRFFKRIVCQEVDISSAQLESSTVLDGVMENCKYDSMLYRIWNKMDGQYEIILDFLASHRCRKLRVSIDVSHVDSGFLMKLPQPADILFAKGDQLPLECWNGDSLMELAKICHSLEMPPVRACTGQACIAILEHIACSHRPQWFSARIEHAARDEFLLSLGLKLKKGRIRTEKSKENVFVYPRIKCCSGHAIDYRGTNIEVSHFPTSEGILCFLHLSNFHHLSEKLNHGFRWFSSSDLVRDVALSQAYISRTEDYFL
ncbi:hypothetical protein PMAYCL1PPCAC_24661, partial [Pristionchus mayeri]